MTDIAERITLIIADHLGVAPQRVTSTAEIFEDLGGDSLDRVELVMAFEDEFKVAIGDQDARAVVTVGDAIALVERALA